MSEALVSGAAGLPPRRLVVTPVSHRHIQRRNARIVAIPKERERERERERESEEKDERQSARVRAAD
jgi:hypothetical protein